MWKENEKEDDEADRISELQIFFPSFYMNWTRLFFLRILASGVANTCKCMFRIK